MSNLPAPRTIFVSYNHGDAAYARDLARALQITGASVWFDEWSIKLGDSIPVSIEAGLQNFDTWVLVWSQHAAKSGWVRSEMDAVLARAAQGSLKLIPVLLDDTPLPLLIGSRLGVKADRFQLASQVAMRIAGLGTDAQLRIMLQQMIDAVGLRSAAKEFWGVGTLVACPQCGAETDKIKTQQFYDEKHDDEYIGCECTICGWQDEGSQP